MDQELEDFKTDSFFLAFTGLEDVVFKLKKCNIPGVNLAYDGMGIGDIHETNVAGDLLTFEELTIEFVVDADLGNYLTIRKWLDRMAEQGGFINEDASVFLTSATGMITGSRIIYENCIPTALGSIELDVEGGQSNLVANAVFVYDKWVYYSTEDEIVYDTSTVDAASDPEAV